MEDEVPLSISKYIVRFYTKDIKKRKKKGRQEDKEIDVIADASTSERLKIR